MQRRSNGIKGMNPPTTDERCKAEQTIVKLVQTKHSKTPVVFSASLILATLMLTLRQDLLFKLYWNLTTGILLLYLPLKYGMNVPEPTLNDSAIILYSANGILAVYLSDKTWKAAVLMVNTLPVAAVYIGLSPDITNCIYSFTTTFIIYYLLCRIPISLCRLVKNIRQWIKLVDDNVAKPLVDSIQLMILVFWMATFAYRAAFPVKKIAHVDGTMSWFDWITFLSTCFVKCSSTPVGLLATSVCVARATLSARLLLEKFLYGFRKTGRHVHYTEGLAEGLFFFLLSINFGLSEEYHIDARLLIDVQHRQNCLKVTSSFVMAVFLETTYQLLDSKIVSFSSSTEISNHIRALMTYIFLLFPSFCVIYTVFKFISIETALAIVCLSCSTIIQILGSLLVYTLFLFNVKYPMENLDETILNIRASVNKLVIAGYVTGASSGLWMVKVRGLDWTTCLITHIYNLYHVRNKYKYESNTFISLLFWLATFTYYATFTDEETAQVDWIMSWSDWIMYLSSCFEKCCRTPVGLLVTSVGVARATPYARLLLEKILYGFRKTGRHIHYSEGLAEGFLFFLCIIFGVAEEYHIDARLLIDVQHRQNLLMFTSSFVMAVFLETTYQLLDSKIVSFSSSTEISKHIRALMTYILLLFPSFCVIYTVCKLMNIGTALAIVCISCSTIIQILGSLLVYTLFLFNVIYPMDNLDEKIFNTRDSVNKLVIAGSYIGAFTGPLSDFWLPVSVLPVPLLMPASYWKKFFMVFEKPVGTYTILKA
ncbi:uncharacterized protein LOC144619294 [Crassostrea virginica]